MPNKKNRLLYRKKIKNGLTNIVAMAKKHTKNIDFSVLKLNKKQKYANHSNTFERVLVILGGRCDVLVDGKSYKNIGKRKNVFEGKKVDIYLCDDKLITKKVIVFGY